MALRERVVAFVAEDPARGSRHLGAPELLWNHRIDIARADRHNGKRGRSTNRNAGGIAIASFICSEDGPYRWIAGQLFPVSF